MSNTRKPAPARKSTKRNLDFDGTLSRPTKISTTIDGEDVEFDIDLVDVTDPTRPMVSALEATMNGSMGGMFDMLALLGIDPDGMRVSQVTSLCEQVLEQMEMAAGESSGS